MLSNVVSKSILLAKNESLSASLLSLLWLYLGVLGGRDDEVEEGGRMFKLMGVNTRDLSTLLPGDFF